MYLCISKKKLHDLYITYLDKHVSFLDRLTQIKRIQKYEIILGTI